MKDCLAVVDGIGMPLGTTLNSIVNADRSRERSEFQGFADGISDGKRTITSLPEGFNPDLG